MKEDNKNIELLLEGFEDFLMSTMIEVRFSSLMLLWKKEIQERFRDQVITLPDYIGKSVELIRCIYPSLETYISKENDPEIAVSWDTAATEIFIFKNNICIDAFHIPTDKIEKVMSQELQKKIRHYFYASGEFNKDPDKKTVLIGNRPRLN